MGWLILATFLGPVLGAGVAAGVIGGLLKVANGRAQHVRYVAANGADLYNLGVPLTQAQFREAFAALRTDLATLPAAPGTRNEWDLQRQGEMETRFSVLTGAWPQAFPSTDDIDEAWRWYSAYGPYALRPDVQTPRPDAVPAQRRLPWLRSRA